MTASQGHHLLLPCQPGTKMLLEVAGIPEKLGTTCVGYARGRFVLTHIPTVPENNRDSLHQMLYPDNVVIVRFLHEGTVLGFSTTVLKAVQIPFPLLFLGYPARLETHDLRRHPRIPCCLPAETELGATRARGMIVDLSLTGCQFSATFDQMPLPSLRIDDRINLSCPLFGYGDHGFLSGAIKRLGISDMRLDIGLKFDALDNALRASLDTYLQHALSVLS